MELLLKIRGKAPSVLPSPVRSAGEIPRVLKGQRSVHFIYTADHRNDLVLYVWIVRSWILDAFLIPAFDDDAGFQPGSTDYNVAWVLLVAAGYLGLHQGKILSGLLFLVTDGLFGIGWVYDLMTLNTQVSKRNGIRNKRQLGLGWAQDIGRGVGPAPDSEQFRQGSL